MSTESSIQHGDFDSEILSLIETLQSTEQRLEELTGGEVDTVASKEGRTFFLRRAQEQFRISESIKQAALLSELRVLFDLMPGMIWFKDTNNNILRVNQRVADSAGIPLQEIEGRPSAEIYPIDAEKFFIEDQIVINSGKPRLGLEEIVHDRDGRPTWVRTDKVPYFDADGKVVGIVVVARDISSTKETEAALKESEANMATAQRISHFGSWVIDMTESKEVNRNSLMWSDEMYRIAGYQPGETEINNDFFLNLVHPEDRKEIEEAMAISIRDGSDYSITHRIVRRDGEVRTLRETAIVFFDETGLRPLRIVGTAHDITEQRRIEIALQESEEHFRFLNVLSESTRLLADPVQIMMVTTEMLGKHLNASRCAYADMEMDSEHFTIRYDYTDGCESTVGHYDLSLFGSNAMSSLHRGESLIIRNVSEELSESDGASTFKSIGINAIITCPLVKDGVLRALLAVHQTTPRNWTETEIATVLESAVRCWSTIELEIAQQTLRASEAEFRTMAESMPQIVWITLQDGSFIYFNQHWMAYTGLSFEDSIGKEWLKSFHPDDQDKTWAAWQYATNVLGHYTVEARIRRSDGEYRWWLIRGVPQLDASGTILKWFGTCTDIHDLKGAEESLRLLGSAVQQAKESIVITDANLNPPGPKIVFVNPAFTEMTGFSAQEAIGQTPRITQGPKTDRYVLDRLRHELEAGLVFEGETINYRKNGSEFFLEWQIAPLFNAHAQITHFVAIQRDSTERKRLDEALQQALQETEAKVEERTIDLKKAVERADSANMAKSEFLSRMSHELRTPMNSVLGYAQLLEMQYSDPRINEAARAILQGGKHLLEMINEVLEFASIESGVLAISQERVNLSEVLSQATDMVRPIANAAEIRLHLNEACTGMYVLADRQRLMQVIINLLSNAIKYNREGGEVFVHCEEIGKGKSIVDVSDTGVGISENDQSKLFLPFQRFGDMGIQGTGLGLSLSQRFVELMDGQLTLATSSEKGSTFRIELRTTEGSVENPPINATYSAAGSLEGFKGTILYIEDNQVNIDFIEAILSDWPDITLFAATQGITGLKIAMEQQPNLVLLDLHLPNMMGDTILRRLKNVEETSQLPVVMLSADATKIQIDRLKAEGASDYLTKPIDLSQFFEMLKDYLPRK